VGSSVDVRPLVLIVDDEQDIADVYAVQLDGPYETRVAYGGEEALEKVDEDVDAVLLDRRMPDRHGDDVLDEIRNRGLTCSVIMVTAVDPDLNILEMDFDDYLCKPVDKETLRSTLEQHIDAPTDNGKINEFFSSLSKLEVLAEEKTEAELKKSEEFKQLAQHSRQLADELRSEVDDFEQLVETYRNVSRGSNEGSAGWL
jgi:DNA-binding response OmpR family regulator